ncbi:ABC transporter ATP-binding protein [Anaerovorax odorimutans]|uniref:ABC transporter ATP-binding protein n=1 Tax=Anaerovorax odorimutans TaxID=109327 RepID=UPI00041CB974|nr:ABC transporter ATP-binding protein [Anaerovorax odorimutans]
MNLIHVKNASFGYDENNLFSNVNLKLGKGQLCCLMGPNGCGKSTLLDCILGIHKLRNGEIEIADQLLSVYKPSQLAKQLAYVPQIHDRSFPYQVIQIVLMGRSAHMTHFQTPSDKDEQIALNALTSVGIAHLADRPYTQISGGEMQLVMLARALVQQTPIIIMDEPTAHLDYKNELLFMETVVKLIKDHGVSVLMATHSPNQAFYFENQAINVKIAIMSKGGIYKSGLPNEILTEESIRRIYQIDSKIISSYDGDYGNLRQIIPLKTL